jgi:alanine racemase
MADRMGTIPYEVFTSIGGLNPRRYLTQLFSEGSAA